MRNEKASLSEKATALNRVSGLKRGIPACSNKAIQACVPSHTDPERRNTDDQTADGFIVHRKGVQS